MNELGYRMRSERLGWEHKDVLHRKFRDINAPLSEYSFPGLYLFRDSHRYEVMFDKELFIKCREDALDFWRAPLYSKQLLTL